MKLALCQMQMTESMDENFAHARAQIFAAAAQGADLICFPEIQLSPFFPQYAGRDASRWAIAPDSRYIRGVQDACREAGIYAAPNFYVDEHGQRYDMSLLIDDRGEILGRQKMVHIAQAACFFEQDYYTPSEEGFGVFQTPLGRIGIVVRFDRHYPESVRTLALRGADLILIPTANTKAEPSELFQWEIRVQAFQSSVNIAMCNRVGREDGMDFSGESLAADHEGRLIAIAGDTEQLLFAEVDLNAAAETRKRKPYTALRRPELYE